jgi:hypothetical protein
MEVCRARFLTAEERAGPEGLRSTRWLQGRLSVSPHTYIYEWALQVLNITKRLSVPSSARAIPEIGFDRGIKSGSGLPREQHGRDEAQSATHGMESVPAFEQTARVNRRKIAASSKQFVIRRHDGK